MKDFRSLEHKIRDVIIAEMEARNTAIRRKMSNVGRPTDNVKDETSKLAKQGEIKTKIIDEAAPDQQTDGAFMKDKDKGDKDKKKKPDAQDEDDPREIKGGKTEVDLKPTTDDSTEDSTKEDETSKKARNKVNKEIGAKGVKEQTMAELNFGLPESLINAVRTVVETKIDEKLIGNQHKIDANHNNKIDAQDFKLLKQKKKMKEEVEELDEFNYRKALNSIEKHHKNRTDKSSDNPVPAKDDVDMTKVGNARFKGSYPHAAARDRVRHMKKAATHHTSMMKSEPGSHEYGYHKVSKDKHMAKANWPVKYVKSHNEETDPGFSDSELARIEEIAKSL